jgi:hypothetical protein
MKRGGRRYDRRFKNTNKIYQLSSNMEMKFAPYIPNKARPATYASVKDAIVLYFKKISMIDVAKSIDSMMLVTLTKPTRQISTKTDKDEKEMEQVGLDIG